MNAAKDKKKYEETVFEEANALLAVWLDDEFPKKIAKFLEGLKKDK